MLEQFLPSVVANTTGDSEVVIADNGSSDDSVDFLQTHYPGLRIIRLEKNYGFAEGYNRALSQVEADLFVLLNDDVEVSPRWIEPVVDHLRQSPRTAVCQPKLLMHAQRNTFEYAGGAGGFIDRLGYPFCRGRLFNTVEKDHGQYDDSREIFWASGAAMFVRADVWQELGGLDGDFFAHMEEIDFCWRAKNRGYQVDYCPASTVYHVGGGTLPKTNPHKTFLNFRNNLCMLYKNLPAGSLHATMALRMLLDWAAAFKFLAARQNGDFRAVFRARREYRRSKPALRQKRAAIRPQKVSQIYPGLIFADYYLRHKRHFGDLR